MVQRLSLNFQAKNNNTEFKFPCHSRHEVAQMSFNIWSQSARRYEPNFGSQASWLFTTLACLPVPLADYLISDKTNVSIQYFESNLHWIPTVNFIISCWLSTGGDQKVINEQFLPGVGGCSAVGTADLRCHLLLARDRSLVGERCVPFSFSGCFHYLWINYFAAVVFLR